ncbi:MAG: hypothetical protein IPP19_14730 [Verrucomicrobia bacterium]|nr:hypothetical protein [Verrucomicrobiota bacterium]
MRSASDESVMIDNWQTPVAIIVVLLALTALVCGAILKRKKPGCGGGCCPPNRFKTGLKDKPADSLSLL